MRKGQPGSALRQLRTISIGSYIFGDAIATMNGTTLSVTRNIRDKRVRLVAVDVDGKELPAEIRSASGVLRLRRRVAT